LAFAYQLGSAVNNSLDKLSKSQIRHTKKRSAYEQKYNDKLARKRRYRRYRQQLKKEVLRPTTAEEKIPWSSKPRLAQKAKSEKKNKGNCNEIG
jgi:hypothetical protein